MKTNSWAILLVALCPVVILTGCNDQVGKKTTMNPDESTALSDSADTQNRYKTFTVQQNVQWKPDSRVLLKYRVDKCSPTANAFLKIRGRGVQVLYYWGGDSWDYKDAKP